MRTLVKLSISFLVITVLLNGLCMFCLSNHALASTEARAPANVHQSLTSSNNGQCAGQIEGRVSDFSLKKTAHHDNRQSSCSQMRMTTAINTKIAVLPAKPAIGSDSAAATSAISVIAPPSPENLHLSEYFFFFDHATDSEMVGTVVKNE